MKNVENPTTKNSDKHDAIAMLIADHKKVKGIFKQYESLMKSDGTESEKAALAMLVCNELKIHAQLEEEIFYPAVREAIDNPDLMDEAEVEHAGAKTLIEQLEAMQPSDDLYDAKMIVLGEQIEHHVIEEEGEMFPEARRAKVDMAALGIEMAERKTELMEEIDWPGERRMDARTPVAAKNLAGRNAAGPHNHR